MKNTNSHRALNTVALAILLFSGSGSAIAQDDTGDKQPTGRVVQDQSGSDFMEEVTPAQPAPEPHKKQVPIIDLSRVRA